MNDTLNDIQKSLLESLSLVANASVKNAKNTVVIEAEVIAVKDAGLKIYTVDYMGNKFTATAKDERVHYQPGNKIYILVPDGDFSKEKIILGLTNPESSITTATSGQVLYHIEKSNNLFIEDDYRAYLCSYKTELERRIPIVFSKAQFVKYFNKYKTYLFSFKVKTNLPKEQQVRGNYGLKLRLFFKEFDLETGQNISKAKDFVFDINNLLGNPYEFTKYTNQNFYITINENYDLDAEPQLFAFVKDFIQDANITTNDIFFEDISLTAVEILTEEQKQGYYLSIAATKGECFLPHGDEEKELTPILRLNGEITNTKYFPCYWFVQDDTIKEDSEYYSSRGGRGWKCLNDKTVQNNTGGDKTYQYITNKQKLTVQKDDIITSRKYKCVLLNEADYTLISAIIEIINLDSETIIELVSATGLTSFVQGSGEVNLICRTNYENAIDGEGTLKYFWSLFDKENNLISSNDFYSVKRYNETYIDKNNNEYKETEISFPTSLIQDLYSVNCSVYYCTTDSLVYKEILLGTERIVLSTTMAPGYRVAITNGGKTFKYDSDGDSPLLDSYDGLDIVTELDPLMFTVIKSDNSELTESEYAFCKFCWKIPKDSMIIPSTEEGCTQDEKYYYIKGQDRQSYYYDLRPKFNPAYTNNTIELEIEFDDKKIVETTTFNIFKEGGNGTNGTKYIAKIICDTFMESKAPIIICSIDDNKYLSNFRYYQDGWGYRPLNDFTFSVRVAQNGESGLNNIETINNVDVEWAMFDEKYTNPCFDIIPGDNLQASIKAKENYSVSDGKVSCNIIQARVKIASAETAGQDYYIYTYFPIPITVVEKSDEGWDVIPRVEGFNEVLYASDGTKPSYSSPNFFWKDEFFEKWNMLYSSKDSLYDISWEVSDNLVKGEIITYQDMPIGITITPKDKYDNGNSCNYVKAIATKKSYTETQLQEMSANTQENKDNIEKLTNENNLLDEVFNVVETFTNSFPTINFISDCLETSKSYIGSRAECIDMVKLLLTDFEEIKTLNILPDSKTEYIETTLNTIKSIFLNGWMDTELISDLDINQYPNIEIQLTDAEKEVIKQNNNVIAANKIFYSIAKYNKDINNYNLIYQYWVLQDVSGYLNLFNTVKTFSEVSYSCIIKDISNVLNDCISILQRPFYTEDYYSYNQNLEIISLLKQRLNGYLIVDDTQYTLQDQVISWLIELKDGTTKEIEELNSSVQVLSRNIDSAYNYNSYTIYPIVMLYNRYEMSAINGWDGNKIYTGPNDEYLYAPQVGAGIKEDDNSFTGMIMGNRYQSGNRQVGLFGYSKGNQSIFLNAYDGSASFGLPGAGQIQILPNAGENEPKAIIQGGKYLDSDTNGTGMQIDLTTPAIKWGNRNFSVDADGHLTAVDGHFIGKIEADEGYFHGTIKANNGEIGGWQIDETKLISEASLENKITLDPNNGISQYGIFYNKDGNKIADGVCWSLSNDGNATFRGNIYLANVGKLSGKLDGQKVPVVKMGKFVARGFETHRANGLLQNAHEVVIRGLDPDEMASGAIMIRKAVEGIDETIYDSDDGHTYPFIVSGTGNLKIGHQKEGEINRHYFSVDSSNGTLRIGYNSNGNNNFIVDGKTGNTTIGGILTVNGDTTIGGTLTINGKTTLGASGVTTIIQNAECKDLKITSGNITLGSNFKVLNDGTLTAKSGTIGNWTIDAASGGFFGSGNDEKGYPNAIRLYPKGVSITINGASYSKAFMIIYAGNYSSGSGQAPVNYNILALVSTGTELIWKSGTVNSIPT